MTDARRREQDKRQVRPCGLMFEPLEQARCTAVGERFFGNQRGADAGVERFGQRVRIAKGDARPLVLAQDFGNDIGVAAKRRENQDALLHELTAATYR